MNYMLAIVLLATFIKPDTVCLSNRHGHVEVALHGGFVTHYVPSGEVEIVAEPVPFFEQTDRELLVGGIPVCWPWFVNQGPKDVPPNGLTRYQTWHVKGKKDGDDRSTLVLEVDDDEWSRSVWKHNYHAELHVVLDERLGIRFTVTNTGTSAMSCNDGFHSYFHVGEAHQCIVKGTDGFRYFNRAEADKGFSRRWTGDFKVEEMQYGYAFQKGPQVVHLVDPLLQRTLEIAYHGTVNTCIWNPGTRNQMFADSWRRFVCVEGANLYESGAYQLAPGATHEISMSVGILRSKTKEGVRP